VVLAAYVLAVNVQPREATGPQTVTVRERDG
jgi:hypothetical protein